jgi:hypothetical protein
MVVHHRSQLCRHGSAATSNDGKDYLLYDYCSIRGMCLINSQTLQIAQDFGNFANPRGQIVRISVPAAE